jgi:hypothetical protein
MEGAFAVNPCFDTVFGGRSPQKLRDQGLSELGAADRSEEESGAEPPEP